MLSTGEQLRVDWLIYNAEAVRIDVLSGSHEGSQLDIGSGDAYMQIVMALVFVGIIFFGWRHNPNGESRRSRNENLSSSAIDEQSLMNLD